MGSWTELVELRESRALEARNQIGFSEVSARFLLDLAVPRYRLLCISHTWTSRIGEGGYSGSWGSRREERMKEQNTVLS